MAQRKKNLKIISIAWFRRDDYPHLLSLFSDGRRLPDAYEDWLNDARQAERLIDNAGHPFARIYIRPAEFRKWCADRRAKPDANARNLFVSVSAAALYDA
jgi:hypothetical protein